MKKNQFPLVLVSIITLYSNAYSQNAISSQKETIQTIMLRNYVGGDVIVKKQDTVTTIQNANGTSRIKNTGSVDLGNGHGMGVGGDPFIKFKLSGRLKALNALGADETGDLSIQQNLEAHDLAIVLIMTTDQARSAVHYSFDHSVIEIRQNKTKLGYVIDQKNLTIYTDNRFNHSKEDIAKLVSELKTLNPELFSYSLVKFD